LIKLGTLHLVNEVIIKFFVSEKKSARGKLDTKIRYLGKLGEHMRIEREKAGEDLGTCAQLDHNVSGSWFKLIVI